MGSATLGRRQAGIVLRLALAVCGLWASTLAQGLTLADLEADRHLTPERLMRYVAEFRYEPGRAVRSQADFLQQRCGDCDDFATLAAEVLRRKGYTTRLVAVFMPAEVHVVCYVAQEHGYLDFNRRKAALPLVRCEGGLATIGQSVARSFHTQWISASEYTLADGQVHYALTEFR